jgi:hypothetical protein
MLIKVSNAKYHKDYSLELVFSDGLKSIVDLRDELEGPVFEPLNDIMLFKSFTLNRWTIEWENGADFAPEFLYELAVKQNKKAIAGGE